MASDPTVHPVSPAVSLFQKAHGRMTTLQRIDEQLAALLDQRRKIQEELRQIQQLINDEFERVQKQSPLGAGRVLSRIADVGREGNGQIMGAEIGGAGIDVAPRVEVGEVIS